MDTLPPTAEPANRRRPVSFTVRSDLMDQARALKLNTSRAAEHGIEVAVKSAMGKAWLAENANAIRAYNSEVSTTPSSMSVGGLAHAEWRRRNLRIVRRIRIGPVEPFPADDAECYAAGVHPHGGAMLDKPEKTRQLITTLEMALPFEVVLTPELIAQLARQQKPVVVKPVETVSQISYLGDEGGIACHIQPDGADAVVVTSLTHVRVPRTLPFAAAVIDYQKHRVKKIRRQQARN